MWERCRRDIATIVIRLLSFVAVAALLLPALATAKVLESATVCGASGCRTIENPPLILVEAGDGYQQTAPAAAPYHTIRYVARDGEAEDNEWTVVWVPSTRMIGFKDESAHRCSRTSRTHLRPPTASSRPAWSRSRLRGHGTTRPQSGPAREEPTGSDG